MAEAGLARVPDQLVEPDDKEGDSEPVEEMSGVGSIMGYSAPLGLDPDKLGRKKNKTHKR